MSRSAEHIQTWSGPAILAYGFRPFFLGGSVWAALAMMLWIPMISGHLNLASSFDPVSWHAHEFLFGFLFAVIAGFLLTAVPNWTGRLPIVGWPLGGLFGLWILGRLVILFSETFSPLAVALVDLSMPVVLASVITREIVAGKNWRNLIVLGMLCALMLGNAVFHWEVAQGDYAAQGYGLRIGLGAGIMMITVIGGRIVPSFTGNWLKKQGAETRPAAPMQKFDKFALLSLLVALVFWALQPASIVTALLLAIAGIVHFARLSRWAGVHTIAEPLVAVLHIAYLLVPLGAVAMAAEIIFPGLAGFGAAQHLWMSGAIGLMTLAVMTRATLGHTGQTLTAGAGTIALYACVLIAAVLRGVAGLWPDHAQGLYWAAGLSWFVAFAGFAALYGPLLLRRPPAKKT